MPVRAMALLLTILIGCSAVLFTDKTGEFSHFWSSQHVGFGIRPDDTNSSRHASAPNFTIGMSEIDEVTSDASASSKIYLPAIASEASKMEDASRMRKETKISGDAKKWHLTAKNLQKQRLLSKSVTIQTD